MNRTASDLLKVVLESENDAWRDDAAEQLAQVVNAAEAEAALFEAIGSPKVDDSLRRTCAESLAEIWINAGEVPREKLDRLVGMPREVVETFLRYTMTPIKNG